MMWNIDEDEKKTLTTTLMVDDYLRSKYLPMVELIVDSDDQEDSSTVSPISTRSTDKRDRKRPNFFHNNMTYGNFDADDPPNKKKPDLSHMQVTSEPMIVKIPMGDVQEALNQNVHKCQQPLGALVDTDEENHEYKENENDNNEE